MSSLALYSRSYTEARDRFCQSAERAGFALSRHKIPARGPDGETLSIDVAERRVADARNTLVVSSGTHGVEGFFGSAVQLGFLEANVAAPSANVVLVHAINPHGFAHIRRVNEDNVDLNRNFALDGERLTGAHALYAKLDPLLNPKSAPLPIDPFLVYAAINVVRHGFNDVKNAVAQGQYEFPAGLFYGGSEPTESKRIVSALAGEWSRGMERVLHVDLHTGMGKWGTYALCIDLPVHSERVARLRAELGQDAVQGFDPSGVLYEMRGSLSHYLDTTHSGVTYDCLLAEFGTRPSLGVLNALRFDNRVAHYAQDDSALVAEARKRMLDAFCPSDHAWRSSAVQNAHAVLLSAVRAVS